MIIDKDHLESLHKLTQKIRYHSDHDAPADTLWLLLQLATSAQSIAIDLTDRLPQLQPPTPDTAGQTPLSPSP